MGYVIKTFQLGMGAYLYKRKQKKTLGMNYPYIIVMKLLFIFMD